MYKPTDHDILTGRLMKVVLLSAILSATVFGAVKGESPVQDDMSVNAASGKAGAAPHVKNNGRLVSIVLLLRAPLKLDERVVSKAVSEALEIKQSKDSDQATFLMAKPPYYRVQVESGAYVVNNQAELYSEDPFRLVRGIENPGLQRTVASHQAWLSIDWAEREPPKDLLRAYQDMGKIIVALAGPDALAVYSPDLNEFSPYNQTIAGILTSTDPLQIFGGVVEGNRTYSMTDDDPTLISAETEARERWPEFVKAFNAKGGKGFSVKGRIVEGNNHEYMWIDVSSIKEGVVHGKLDNEPEIMTSLQMGQKLQVKVEDVDDWVYLDTENKPIGAFTSKVFQ